MKLTKTQLDAARVLVAAFDGSLTFPKGRDGIGQTMVYTGINTGTLHNLHAKGLIRAKQIYLGGCVVGLSLTEEIRNIVAGS